MYAALNLIMTQQIKTQGTIQDKKEIKSGNKGNFYWRMIKFKIDGEYVVCFVNEKEAHKFKAGAVIEYKNISGKISPAKLLQDAPVITDNHTKTWHDEFGSPMLMSECEQIKKEVKFKGIGKFIDFSKKWEVVFKIEENEVLLSPEFKHLTELHNSFMPVVKIQIKNDSIITEDSFINALDWCLKDGEVINYDDCELEIHYGSIVRYYPIWEYVESNKELIKDVFMLLYEKQKALGRV